MTEAVELQMISRRKSLSLFGLVAAMGLVAPATLLTTSEAEAQTAGMERREDRREGRRQRRQGRRDARQERREARRDARLERREGRREARDTRRAARRGAQ
jgi:hypothetical protein